MSSAKLFSVMEFNEGEFVTAIPRWRRCCPLKARKADFIPFSLNALRSECSRHPGPVAGSPKAEAYSNFVLKVEL